MGKYTELVKALGLTKVMPFDDPSFRQAVDAVKQQLATGEGSSVPDLIRKYAEFKAKKAALESEKSQIEVSIKALEEILEKAFEAVGVSSMKLDRCGTLSINPEPVPRITDREKLRQWCIRAGLEKSLALHPKTLESLLKDRLLNGEDAPEGVEPHFINRFNFRRS